MHTPKMTSLPLLSILCSWITFVGCISFEHAPKDPRIPQSHVPCGQSLQIGYYRPRPLFYPFYSAQDLEQDLVISRNIRFADGSYSPTPLFKKTFLQLSTGYAEKNKSASDDIRCSSILDIFSSFVGVKKLENDPDGFTSESHEIGLSLHNDFAFPDTLDAADVEPETQTTALVAHLSMEHMKKKLKNEQHIIKSNVQQVLKVRLSCDTSAVVKKNWAPKLDIDNPEFCKLNDQGEHICVEFRHTFDSNKCTFAQKVPIKIEQETVQAHIIGEINVNNDQEYSILIREVSLPRP